MQRACQRHANTTSDGRHQPEHEARVFVRGHTWGHPTEELLRCGRAEAEDGRFDIVVAAECGFFLTNISEHADGECREAAPI